MTRVRIMNGMRGFEFVDFQRIIELAQFRNNVSARGYTAEAWHSYTDRE